MPTQSRRQGQGLRAAPVVVAAVALLILIFIEYVTPRLRGRPATTFRYNEADHCGRFRPAVSPREMARNVRTLTDKKWCGQFGQDRVVASLLNATTSAIRGTFVDLAANDAIRNSNTYALEKLLGWNGLCVEPNPKYHAGFEAGRRCALAKTCASNERKDVVLELSGGKGHIASSATGHTLQLPCEPLSTLLTKHGLAGRPITYLSLDVEGGELDALRGVDWETTAIDVLTVERASAELITFLAARGYARVLCVALDSVFVAERLRGRAADWYGRVGKSLEPQCISNDLEACSSGALFERCYEACTRTRCAKR